jgi:MtN3 and saliva related transmembrane protein
MPLSIEILGYLAAFSTTCAFLPQAILTIRTRETDSLSLGMYSLFTTGVLLWLIYGLYIQNSALILANAITFMLSALILSFKLISVVKGFMNQRALKK